MNRWIFCPKIKRQTLYFNQLIKYLFSSCKTDPLWLELMWFANINLLVKYTVHIFAHFNTFRSHDYLPSAMGLSGLWYSGKSKPSVLSPMDWEISARSSIRSPQSGLPRRESPRGDGGLYRSPAMVGDRMFGRWPLNHQTGIREDWEWIINGLDIFVSQLQRLGFLWQNSIIK